MSSNLTKSQRDFLSRLIEDAHPEIIEEYRILLEKPKPDFVSITYFAKILSKFCEYKGITEDEIVGVKFNNTAVRLRSVFVGLIISLYNPELITGFALKTKNNLRFEISELLQCDPAWVSQSIKEASVFLNTSRRLPAFKEFADEVNELVVFVKDQLLPKKAEFVERDMFTELSQGA